MGRYQLLREVAKGPFGPLVELRADDDKSKLGGLGRVITLASDLTPDAERIISDAAWDALELRHDLLQSVADVVFGSGWITLVHDHTEGSILLSLLRRAQERQSAFPLAVTLRVALDLIDGLEHTRAACQAAQIAYRPGGNSLASMYLCGDGRTRLLDAQFNATLLASAAMRTIATSPGYPPPEVIAAESDLSPSTDVFVVGATLWALLTGRELHDATSPAAPDGSRPLPPPLDQSLPKGSKVPGALIKAVTTAIEHNPKDRPQTLLELRRLVASTGQAASYEKVIDFTDALLHRESTLFRLTLDPSPKLSDEVRVERPKGTHLSWAVELAKQARATEGPRGAQTAAGPAPKPVAILPTAVFTPSGPAPKLSGAPRAAQTSVGAQTTNARKTLVGIQAPRVSLTPKAPPALASAVASAQEPAQPSPIVEPVALPVQAGPAAQVSPSTETRKSFESSPSATQAVGKAVLKTEPAPTPISEPPPTAPPPTAPPPTAKVPIAKLTEIVGRAEALIQDIAPPIVQASEGSSPLTSWSPNGPTTEASTRTPAAKAAHQGTSLWKVALLVAASNLATAGVTFALSRQKSPTSRQPEPNRSAAAATPAVPARQDAAPVPSVNVASAADNAAPRPVTSEATREASSAMPPPSQLLGPAESAAVTQAPTPVPTQPVRVATPPTQPVTPRAAPPKRKKKYTPREL